MALVFFWGVEQGVAHGEGNGSLSFALFPQEIVFSGGIPEEGGSANFSLFLKTSDPMWALAAYLESEEEEAPENLLFLKTPFSRKPLPLSPKPTLIVQGNRPEPEGVEFRDLSVLLVPPWTVEAGKYTLRLVFLYQGGGGSFPFPQSLSISIDIVPTFRVELQSDLKGIIFDISGPPGLYPAIKPLSFTARANVTPWKILCSIQDLVGEKGGRIPPSRVFVTVQGKRFSLEKPVEICTAQAGDVVSIPDLLLSVETLPGDLPDRYTGEIAIACSFARKGGIR